MLLSQSQVGEFHEQGYTVVRNVLSTEELVEFGKTFDSFVYNKRGLDLGNDYGDQSQGISGANVKDISELQLINVNVPCRHDPSWANNIFEERAQRIAQQLFPAMQMEKDYEQLLMKLERRSKAVFAWHQDAAYWPKKMTKDVPQATATISLAINEARRENGCLRVIPGTHNDGAPLWGDYSVDQRAIVLQVPPERLRSAVYLPLGPGDVTVHNHLIVHGSGANMSDATRKTYVVAFRDRRMIEYERFVGYSHSYNDDPEVLLKCRKGDL